MKLVVSILVMLSLTFQCFVQLGVMGYYQFNQKYIAANLCVNRDKPQSHCNGKCHLKKMMKKTEKEGEQQGQSSSSESLNFVFFLIPGQVQLRCLFPVIVSTTYAPHNIVYSGSYLRDIFHPPPPIV